jgi:hypothetical protein
MIKLKSLIETRIIEPEDSLLVGDITLYHGTDYNIALEAKRGELGPVDTKEYVINILTTYFKEPPENAEKIYKKVIIYRNESNPPRLFLTTDKEQAASYAKNSTIFGGEIVSIILFSYLNKNNEYNRYRTIKPAVVTFTVPLSMVLTHPFWTTPARDRILSIIRQMRKRPEIAKDINKLQPLGIEVFVKEKIPAKYFQRIDLV